MFSRHIDQSGIVNIILSGNLALLGYLKDEIPLNIQLDRFIKEAMESGNLALVKSIFNPKSLPDQYSVIDALANGHFEIVEWILENLDIADNNWKNQKIFIEKYDFSGYTWGSD